MNERDDDLRARLRAADPAESLPGADPAEVDRLLERVVNADLRETGARRRNPLTWLVAAAAVVVIAAGAALWATQSPSGKDDDGGLFAGPGQTQSPTASAITELTVGQPGFGRCMMPSVELLRTKPIAFAGTVEGVSDGVVTLRVTKVYTGDVGQEITVKGATAVDTGGAPEGDPTFETGRDYLVAADDGQVLGCGMSGPATPRLQDLYAQAFGS